MSDDAVNTLSLDDKREFVRCILGSRQFAKQYSLLGGEILLEFKSISIHAYNTLKDLASNSDWSVRDLKVLFYLRSTNIQKVPLLRSPELSTTEEIAEALKKFQEIPEPTAMLIYNKLSEFILLEKALLEEVLCSNFTM